jgi:hypothetical protein
MKAEDILLGAVLALLFVFVAGLIRKQTTREVIVRERPWRRHWYPVNYWEHTASYAGGVHSALPTSWALHERPGERVAIYPNAWISPWAYGRYVGYG